MELGTVIATMDGPSPGKFSFVVTENGKKMPVRQGQFVEVNTEEGRLVAFVTNLVKTNRYFMQAESVREYERRGGPMAANFPVDRWEYLIAEALTLGIQGDNGLERSTFPPSPGQRVSEVELGGITEFLGLDQNGGVELGRLKHHDVPVKLDLTRLLRKHVAVLAKSGAGKCLGYENPVLLSTGDVIPIGKLVDSAIERGGKETRRGIEFTTRNSDNLSILTIRDDLKLEKKRIGAFIRRRYSDKLLKMKMRSGKELTLTKNHPLLKFDGKVHWTPAGELNPGDKIAAPRSVETSSHLQTLNLTEFLHERGDVFAVDIQRTLGDVVQRAKTNGWTLKKLAEASDISHNGFKNWLKSGNVPLKKLKKLATAVGFPVMSEVKQIGVWGARPVSVEITLDPDFARFVGYLFAEGHNNGNALSFTNSDEEILSDFVTLSKKIARKNPHIIKVKTAKTCLIFSRIMAIIMDEVFGVKNSTRTKEIPDYILRSPEQVVVEYLKALFDCDGYCALDKPTLEICFTNHDNVPKIQALLLRFGILSKSGLRTRKISDGNRLYSYVWIDGTDNLRRFYEHIGFITARKKERLRNHLSKKSNPNVDLIPCVGGVIKSLCEKLRLSYSEFARRTQVQEAVISNYVNSRRNPSRGSLGRLVKTLESRAKELEEIEEELEKLRTGMRPLDQKEVFGAVKNAVDGGELSYKKIANACGVSATTVGRMVQGRTRVTDNVFDIALGVSCLSNGVVPLEESFAGVRESITVDKGTILRQIHKMVSAFGLSGVETDKHANLWRGATRSYITAERRPPYSALIAITNVLDDLLQEMKPAIKSAKRDILFLRDLSTSDVFWDEVSNIEETEVSGHVYDLSIDGSDNFIAGNLIVHNSYFTSVMIEELLDRSPEEGRPAVIIVDVHGEYRGLAWNPAYAGRVSLVNGRGLRIGVPNLSPYQFQEFLPEMSGVQARELQRVLKGLRAEMQAGGGAFGLDEVISRVEGNGGNKQLQQALVGWLHGLKSLGFFDRADNPSWELAAEPGKLVVVDLSDMTNLRKKQMLLTYMARRLFNARKRKRVPPFVLCLEEAHQFCVDGNSLILSPQGMVTMKELVERELANGRVSQESVEFAAQPSNHKIIALGRDLKVAQSPIKQYFRLQVPERLRISLDNGIELVTTPKTPLLSVDQDGTKWVPASEVGRGGYVGVTNSVKVEEKSTYLPSLLPDETMVYLDETFAHELLESFTPAYRRMLGRKYYHWRKTHCAKLDIIKELAEKRGPSFRQIMSHTCKVAIGGSKGIKIPLFLDEEFLYFLGLMASDGHLGKYNRRGAPFYEVGFSNTDQTLIARYRNVVEKLFGVNVKTRLYSRKEPWSKIYKAVFGSKILFLLLKRLGIRAGRNDENDLPSEIMCAPQEMVKGYLRGLFDGDGWANDVAKQVGVCNKSKTFLEKVRFLLLRFDISSSIRKNRDGNFELRTSGKDAKRFCVEIGFNHPKKKMAAQNIVENTSDFSFDSIPYPSCLKKMRKKLGLSMRDLGVCSKLESGRCNITRKTLHKILKKLERVGDRGMTNELMGVRKMVESDVRWCRITKVEKLGGGEVYDLTVNPVHNFIANGVVVHNCPSGESKSSAISRSIIETIAREGRKFYASLVLISQRPVRLSTTVLSQANTNVILRVTNPYDLEHIRQSSEAITSEVAGMISSLPVGEALVVGEAVNHPVFMKVRRRKTRESGHGARLEEVARDFERRRGKEMEDAKAFM